jgi:hypothetical protein
MKEVLVLLLVLTTFGYPQKSAKHKQREMTAPLNARQIDFVNRLHADLSDGDNKYLLQIYTNLYGEAAHASSVSSSETLYDYFKRRIPRGLLDRGNLIDVVTNAKESFDPVSIRHVFPRLDQDEVNHLVSMSKEELWLLARKYSYYLNAARQEELARLREYQKLPKY